MRRLYHLSDVILLLVHGAKKSVCVFFINGLILLVLIATKRIKLCFKKNNKKLIINSNSVSVTSCLLSSVWHASALNRERECIQSRIVCIWNYLMITSPHSFLWGHIEPTEHLCVSSFVWLPVFHPVSNVLVSMIILT